MNCDYTKWYLSYNLNLITARKNYLPKFFMLPCTCMWYLDLFLGDVAKLFVIPIVARCPFHQDLGRVKKLQLTMLGFLIVGLQNAYRKKLIFHVLFCRKQHFQRSIELGYYRKKHPFYVCVGFCLLCFYVVNRVQIFHTKKASFFYRHSNVHRTFTKLSRWFKEIVNRVLIKILMSRIRQAFTTIGHY